ncbi:ATP-binding cassette domain-containing protein, partial [Kitasatospora sp. NPDC058263]
MTTNPVLRLESVRKSFGSQLVLRDVDLTVPEHTVTALIGASGSGKSTLLRVINHLEKPEIGHVSLNGELIGVRRQRGRLKELSERAILA